MKKFMTLLIAFVLALVLVSCNKEDNGKKISFKLEVPATVELEEGESFDLSPEISGEGEYSVAYSFDNEDCIQVTDNKVIAISEGTVQVTAQLKVAKAGEGEGEPTWENVDLEPVTFTVKVKPVEIMEDYISYSKYNLSLVYNAIVPYLTDDQAVAAKAAYDAGLAAIAADKKDGNGNPLTAQADLVNATKKAYTDAVAAIRDCIPLANGIYSYVGLSNAEKTEILGLLENYCISKGTTGISLFENGNYVMYNERIKLGTENYITGYGFGTLAEGDITAPLASETNDAWKYYYHSVNTADPGTANYLNDQGSEVGDFYGYIASSFWTTFMNDEKNGYDWVPELAVSEKPIAVNADDTGAATTWKFEVRKDVKYTTNSTIASRQAFNNRTIELEDYITPFKLLLTKKNNLYRGSELANTKNGGIKGAKAYYDASENGFDAQAWENVGVKAYEEEGKWYFEVEFTQKYSQFYAMYYISSSLYMPIPQSFLDLVTVENYLGFNEDMTETPVDNTLCLGAYAFEKWESDVQVVYGKNPNYVYADTKYAVKGVHIRIFPAAKEDTTATIKEFLAGNIDAAGIPQDYLNDYKNDPRTRQTKGDSNFKLNINATDADTWTALFGVDGTVCQTEEEDYWSTKAVLSNRFFTKGLSYAIDRLSFASARGSVPAADYFSSAYMSDNENGMSYNSTDEHKAAIAQLLDNTDGYGYSLELSRDYFRMALAELEAAGQIAPGTVKNPTQINIEIAWMYAQHEGNYHNEIKSYLEKAFNDYSVTGGKYSLSVNFWVGDEWSDVYYNKMLVGQFDLGFGSISGNTLDPLGFMNVLSSDKAISNSFTLNWGVDTNNPDEFILVYDGLRFSYDALFNAATSVAFVGEGKNVAAYGYGNAEWDEETKTLTFDFYNNVPESQITVDDVVIYGYTGSGDDYAEQSLENVTTVVEGTTIHVTVVVSDAEFADYQNAYANGSFGFDLYISGEVADLETTYAEFEGDYLATVWSK